MATPRSSRRPRRTADDLAAEEARSFAGEIFDNYVNPESPTTRPATQSVTWPATQAVTQPAAPLSLSSSSLPSARSSITTPSTLAARRTSPRQTGSGSAGPSPQSGEGRGSPPATHPPPSGQNPPAAPGAAAPLHPSGSLALPLDSAQAVTPQVQFLLPPSQFPQTPSTMPGSNGFPVPPSGNPITARTPQIQQRPQSDHQQLHQTQRSGPQSHQERNGGLRPGQGLTGSVSSQQMAPQQNPPPTSYSFGCCEWLFLIVVLIVQIMTLLTKCNVPVTPELPSQLPSATPELSSNLSTEVEPAVWPPTWEHPVIDGVPISALIPSGCLSFLHHPDPYLVLRVPRRHRRNPLTPLGYYHNFYEKAKVWYDLDEVWRLEEPPFNMTNITEIFREVHAVIEAAGEILGSVHPGNGLYASFPPFEHTTFCDGTRVAYNECTDVDVKRYGNRRMLEFLSTIDKETGRPWLPPKQYGLDSRDVLWDDLMMNWEKAAIGCTILARRYKGIADSTGELARLKEKWWGDKLLRSWWTMVSEARQLQHNASRLEREKRQAEKEEERRQEKAEKIKKKWVW